MPKALFERGIYRHIKNKNGTQKVSFLFLIIAFDHLITKVSIQSGAGGS
jgi:hypothetical protein